MPITTTPSKTTSVDSVISMVNPSISETKKNFPEPQNTTLNTMPQKTLTNPKLKEKMAQNMKKSNNYTK